MFAHGLFGVDISVLDNFPGNGRKVVSATFIFP